MAITTKIAQEIKGVAYAPDDSFTVRERLYLLKRVADLRSTIARAERIVQTPMPLHYARHTSRFLTLWCLTLPSTRLSGSIHNSAVERHLAAAAAASLLPALA